MFSSNKNNLYKAADYIINDLMTIKDVSEILGVNAKTIRKALYVDLAEYDADKYNEVMSVMESDRYKHSKVINNARLIFKEVIRNKDIIKDYSELEKICKRKTLLAYLNRDYIRQECPEYAEVKNIINNLTSNGKVVYHDPIYSKANILATVDFIINTGADISEAAEYIKRGKETVRKYIAYGPSVLGEDRYENLHKVLEESKQKRVDKNRKESCKRLLDYIIENKCKLREASRALNMSYSNTYYILNFAEECYPNEYKLASKIIGRRVDKSKETKLLYKYLVEDRLPLEEVSSRLGMTKNDMRLKLQNCLRKTNREKYLEALKVLNSFKKENKHKFRKETIMRAEYICKFIIDNKVSIKTASRLCGINYNICKYCVSDVMKKYNEELYLKTMKTVDIVSCHPRRSHSVRKVRTTMNGSKDMIKSNTKTSSKETKKTAHNGKVNIKENNVEKKVKQKSKVVSISSTNDTTKSVKKSNRKTSSKRITKNKSININGINLSDSRQKEIAEELVGIMEGKGLNIYEASEALCINVDIAQKCLFNNSDVFDDMLESIL